MASKGNPELLYGQKSAADFCGLSVRSLRNKIRAGHLSPAFTEPGRGQARQVFAAADLRRIAGRPTPAGALYGRVFTLGRHRLAVGDCRDPALIAELFRGTDGPDGLLTDPPYASGGFHESSRGVGGASAVRHGKPVKGDAISTRGYRYLLKAALDTMPQAKLLAGYIFVDWRMWVHLFDIVEEQGYQGRQMLVWDKESPALGSGWRAQHELIMVFVSRPGLWYNYRREICPGNVIRLKRQANERHTTQKPEELLAHIMTNTPFAQRIYDPFAGSGSTIWAADQVERQPAVFAVEKDLDYAQSILDYWRG